MRISQRKRGDESNPTKATRSPHDNSDATRATRSDQNGLGRGINGKESNKSTFVKIHLQTGDCLLLKEIQQLHTEYKIIHKQLTLFSGTEATAHKNSIKCLNYSNFLPNLT